MLTLLVIESSPRGDHSMSRGLTARFVAQWLKNNLDGRVVERDLMKTVFARFEFQDVFAGTGKPGQYLVYGRLTFDNGFG
jgi:FMN-dependent NADH-azoreductase